MSVDAIKKALSVFHPEPARSWISVNKLGWVYRDTICGFSGSDEETWPTLSQQSTKRVRQLKSNKGHKAERKHLHFSVAQTHPSPASLHEWSHFVKSAWNSWAQPPMNRHKISTSNDWGKEQEVTFSSSLQTDRIFSAWLPHGVHDMLNSFLRQEWPSWANGPDCIHELRTKLMKLFSEDKTPAWEHSREVGVLLQNHLFAVSCVVQNSEHAWRFFCHRNWCQWIRNIGWGQLHRKTLIWEFVIPHSRKSKACRVLATLAINLWRSLESNGNRTATMSRYFSSQSLRHWENWSRWAL